MTATTKRSLADFASAAEISLQTANAAEAAAAWPMNFRRLHEAVMAIPYRVDAVIGIALD
jgi:hypothetical protein